MAFVLSGGEHSVGAGAGDRVQSVLVAGLPSRGPCAHARRRAGAPYRQEYELRGMHT